MPWKKPIPRVQYTTCLIFCCKWRRRHKLSLLSVSAIISSCKLTTHWLLIIWTRYGNHILFILIGTDAAADIQYVPRQVDHSGCGEDNELVHVNQQLPLRYQYTNGVGWPNGNYNSIIVYYYKYLHLIQFFVELKYYEEFRDSSINEEKLLTLKGTIFTPMINKVKQFIKEMMTNLREFTMRAFKSTSNNYIYKKYVS